MNPPNPPSIILYMASLLSKYILSCLGIVDSIVDILSHSAAPSGSQIPLPCLNSISMFLNKPENTHPASSKLVLPFMPFLLPGSMPESPSFRIRKQCSLSHMSSPSQQLSSGTISLRVAPTHAILSSQKLSGGRGDAGVREWRERGQAAWLHGALCHGNGRKQFLGHMSRICLKEARMGHFYLVKSCI